MVNRFDKSSLTLKAIAVGAVGLAHFAVTGCIPESSSKAPVEHGEAAGAPSNNLPKITDGPWTDSALPPTERVDSLLEAMTQDEKLTLLMGYYGADAEWRGYTASPEARPGSAGFVPGIPRLGIPTQWQTDAGMGVATQGKAEIKRERTALPSGLATASTWSPKLAERGGKMIGTEARASGFNVMLAGSVNLLRDPYCGRNFEYAGEDPYLAGVMVGAQVAGIQSNHIISTMKHYAVNDQETDRDKGDSILARDAARMSDLLAFELTWELGNPGSVMCAYNKVNGTYACEHEWLLTQVLRKDWGFTGYVLSDWGAVHSTVQAANAGLEQASGFPFDEKPYFGAPLKQAVEAGKVSQARLDEMAGRVLHAMFEHGLFDHPVKLEDIDFQAHAAISRADAEEGAVLLKNDDALLPLGDQVGTIAMIGGYADKGVLSGGGSAQVYPRGENVVPGLSPTSWPGPVVYYPSSPLAHLQRLMPKTKISFASGTKKKAAAELAKKSDVAIVFVTQWATESIDTTVTLPDGQDELVAAVAAANPKTIVVLETGGPVLMPWAGSVGAVLQAWYPGTEGGSAIARLLTGRVNPSGHLPLTIPRKKEHWTHHTPPKPGKVRYDEGATVGYKWFDEKGYEPLFPFGHGLSYTEFAHEDLKATASGSELSVSFTSKNTGKTKGKDVAQIYLAQKGWEAPQRLGGFAKVDLKPGERTTVELRIDPRLLAVWSSKEHAWVIEKGPVEVRLATTSRNVVHRTVVELEAATIPASGPEPNVDERLEPEVKDEN